MLLHTLQVHSSNLVIIIRSQVWKVRSWNLHWFGHLKVLLYRVIDRGGEVYLSQLETWRGYKWYWSHNIVQSWSQKCKQSMIRSAWYGTVVFLLQERSMLHCSYPHFGTLLMPVILSKQHNNWKYLILRLMARKDSSALKYPTAWCLFRRPLQLPSPHHMSRHLFLDHISVLTRSCNHVRHPRLLPSN